MLRLLLLVLLCGANVADAQVLSGRVVDAMTGFALSGSSVVRADGRGGTATNAEGEFRLRVEHEGEFLVRVSYIGYATLEVLLSTQQPETRIALHPAYLSTGDVVITAARSAQSRLETAVSVEVLGIEAIQSRGIRTLDEALRLMPGVQLADNQVSIRGSSGFSYNTGSRVLFLVDGVPLLGPDSEGIPLTMLPMDVVERVEVLKGPGSALYGGGALGGIVHLISRGYPDAPSTSITLQGGASMPFRYPEWRLQWDQGGQPRPLGEVRVAHARRVGRGGFWVTTSHQYTAGHLRLAESQRTAVYGKTSLWVARKARMDVLAGVTRSYGDSFLYWNGLVDPLNPGTLSLGGGSTTGSNDNLTYRFSLLPSLTLTPSSRLSIAARARMFGVTVQPIDEAGVVLPIDRGTLGFRTGGEVQAHWLASSLTQVIAGVSADANGARLSFFGPDPAFERQPEGAVFGQVTHTVSERFEASAGLRLDAYRLRAGDVVRQLSPRASVRYLITPNVAVRASAGRGFRVPGVAERYVNDDSFLPLLSNVNLRPETSTGGELGLRMALLPMAGVALNLDLAAFHTTYRDLVEPVFVTQGSRVGFQFVNLTQATLSGIEARLEATHRLFSGEIGWQGLRARDTDLEQPLVFRSPHLVQSRLHLHLPAGLRAGADLRFSSRPERVDTDFARFIPDADQLPATRVVDARLQWNRGGVELGLFVRNLFDYYYAERPALLAPPRTVGGQVKLTF